MTDNVIKAPARPAWAAELNDQEMLFVSAYRRLPAPTEQPMTIDVTPACQASPSGLLATRIKSVKNNAAAGGARTARGSLYGSGGVAYILSGVAPLCSSSR